MGNFINRKDILDTRLVENYGIFLKIDRTESFINTIDPVITKSCNLCCPHCWGNNNECGMMSMENYKKILKLAEYLNINSIQYTGGEPLLHPQLFDFAKESKNKGFKNRLRTNFATKTLSEEFLTGILEYFECIYISLDGLAEDNFYLRPSRKFMVLKNNNPEEAEKCFAKYANENFNIIKTNIDNLIKIKNKFHYKNRIIIASVVQRYNLDKIAKMIDFINQYDDIRWDITQVSLDENNPRNINIDEFESKIFDIAKFSKNIVKIKFNSFPRCLSMDNIGDIMLSHQFGIKVDNYLISDFATIRQKISFKIKNNNYFNYLYIPLNKMDNLTNHINEN